MTHQNNVPKKAVEIEDCHTEEWRDIHSGHANLHDFLIISSLTHRLDH